MGLGFSATLLVWLFVMWGADRLLWRTETTNELMANLVIAAVILLVIEAVVALIKLKKQEA